MMRLVAYSNGHRSSIWLAVPMMGLALAGCGPRHSPDFPAPARLTMEVQEILNAQRSSAEFYAGRMRLEELGPEVDAVLVSLARHPRVRPVARANALIILADRESPAALPALRRALLEEEMEMLRSAAVLGLQRLSATTPEALPLIRSALGDPARTVRLNALQSLDVRDVDAIRELIRTEPDRSVRQVAMQLVALAETRGAPLEPDEDGIFRSAGTEEEARLLFIPSFHDRSAGYATGELRVDLPATSDLTLAAVVEVVADVVPAFFSPDRSAVVYEVEREIQVMDLLRRRIQRLGPGIAPRMIPFSQQFVFLRQLPDPIERPEGTEFRYEVVRGSFDSGATEVIGEIRAVARPDRHANYSPVRWMVVAEGPEGFVLRGDGVTTFPLPEPGASQTPGSDASSQAIGTGGR